MRASSKAVMRWGWPALAAGGASKAMPRASSASASSVGMGSTGNPAPRRAPNARPCATAQAVRRPVNEPGPWPNAMASSVSSVRPASLSACASSARMAGISVVDAFAPPGPVCCQSRTPSVSAIDITSVDVSNARKRDMAAPAVVGASKQAETACRVIFLIKTGGSPCF